MRGVGDMADALGQVWSGRAMSEYPREAGRLMKLKAEPEWRLFTYFLIHNLDTNQVDDKLKEAGLTVSQIEDIWETKVRDVDPILFIQLTGRTYPGYFGAGGVRGD